MAGLVIAVLPVIPVTVVLVAGLVIAVLLVIPALAVTQDPLVTLV